MFIYLKGRSTATDYYNDWDGARLKPTARNFIQVSYMDTGPKDLGPPAFTRVLSGSLM